MFVPGYSPERCVGRHSAGRRMWPRRRPFRVEVMDITSMLMGASIASIAWVGFYPWEKLKRLRAMEATEESAGDSASQ
jgi:hypothetical protein